MDPLYPMRFEPLFRQYIWGGRRLASELGKPIGEGDDYAESWEICDHGADQSIVTNGPLAGVSLAELSKNQTEGVYGPKPWPTQFPLLLKFLDCNRTLSVQVHPNDAQAARLDPPDLGKTEAWVILDATPGSKVYSGLKRGVDRAMLSQAIDEGRCEECLHAIEAKPGDCIFVPAGTVHALGEGLLVAEIQQSSDTTYRLFDWNRVGGDGKPRPLHVEQALDVIDFARGEVNPQRVHPQTAQSTSHPFAEQLVDCDKFVLNRLKIDSPVHIAGDSKLRILACTSGAISVSGDPSSEPLERGQSMLIPAATGPVKLVPREPSTVLEIYLP